MKFIAQYSLKENCRRKCYFIISFISCFLVSLICLVAKTIVSQGALIFLMLGEKDAGEIDFILTPNTRIKNSSLSHIDDFYRDNAFINFTKYGELMRGSEDEETGNPFDTSTIRSYFNGHSESHQLYLMLIDTEREKEIELGRTYPFSKLKVGECLVHKNLIKNDTKKKFDLTITMKTFLVNTILDYYKDTINDTDKELDNFKNIPTMVDFQCDIVDTFEDNFGKESSEDDNIVIMELEYFYKYIQNFIPKIIKEIFPDYAEKIKNIKGEEYGNILIINFPKNRLNYYAEDDYDKLLESGVRYMNKIVQNLGSFHDYKVDMPLIKTMNKFKMGTTFLNLILNLILIGIFGLSLILIYSLLIIITETNSFEFGVLRLIGNSKLNIIFLIIFQCLCFSIPAFIVALAFSFLFINIINNVIKNELDTDLGISLNLSSFILAFFLNLLAPIIAAILPIRKILKKNIATSINTMINKTQGVKIEIISLKKQELTSLIFFGLITFLYGASIYYFLPLSLVSLNLGMIGAIFLWILFGILLGFILLSRNIENLLNKILTYILLFFTKSYTKMLILKNLTAHKIKNRKTSLMFSLSIGIFIMISVGFDLILQSTKNMSIQQEGSEIIFYADNEFFTPDETTDALMALYDEDLIEDFGLYTFHINNACFEAKSYILNYGKTVESLQNVLGVNSAYFSSTSKIDLKIAEQNENFQDYTPSEQLYFSDFKGKIGISGIFKYEFNAKIDSNIFLKLKTQKKDMLFLSKSAFILDSGGGLKMNSQPSYRGTRESIISIPFYLDILQKCRNYFSSNFQEAKMLGYRDLPLWGINIKPKEAATEKDISRINTILRRLGPFGETWLFANLKKNLDTISTIVSLIFYIICTIVLIFCLFNLTASMTINIYEQRKEISILRTLGTKKWHTIFIYIAEAFILILSSGIIGTVIGSIISYTMALQWVFFTNVNVEYNLPVGHIILIFVFSILGGILSSFFPARNMLKNSIAQLIKSN